MKSSNIGFQILAYLADNPEAQDTLEGIAQWWLLERKIQSETRQITDALSELVERGLLLRTEGGNSRARYRVNPDKQNEIMGLIQKPRG